MTKIINSIVGTWREDSSMSSIVEYEKKFAFWKKIECADGTILRFKHYYKKYRIWSHDRICGGEEYSHRDFVENVSEEDFVVRKLAENL